MKKRESLLLRIGEICCNYNWLKWLLRDIIEYIDEKTIQQPVELPELFIYKKPGNQMKHMLEPGDLFHTFLDNDQEFALVKFNHFNQDGTKNITPINPINVNNL